MEGTKGVRPKNEEIDEITTEVINFLSLFSVYAEGYGMVTERQKEAEGKPCHRLLAQLVGVLEAKGSALNQEAVQIFFLLNNFYFILGKVKGKLEGIVVASAVSSKLNKRVEELLEQYKRYT